MDLERARGFLCYLLGSNFAPCTLQTQEIGPGEGEGCGWMEGGGNRERGDQRGGEV